MVQLALVPPAVPPSPGRAAGPPTGHADPAADRARAGA